MHSYLDIVDRVLTKGRWKSPVRWDGEEFVPVDGGERTLACPNVHFSHDLQSGFPLLTTKKMAYRSMAVELEGFIKGITSKEWYKARKCKIWNEWCNPVKLADKVRKYAYDAQPGERDPGRDLIKQWQFEEDDLGPIYGYQWRRFGEQYDPYDNGVLKGFDQFKSVVDKLEANPHDRRMVVSAWNPNQLSRMALPPCHLIWVVTVIDGHLSLHWTQRSCDLMYGVPFNIASYALLAYLLAAHAGLKVDNLSGTLCDCHIYERQIDGAKEQLNRKPYELPDLVLPSNLNIWEWTADQIEIDNYQHRGRLSFGDVVV